MLWLLSSNMFVRTSSLYSLFRWTVFRWSKWLWWDGIWLSHCGHIRSPNTGWHRVEKRHWESLVPLVPRSSALSHMLHQLAATRSEQTMCFRDTWWFLALLTDWDQSCFRMMFRRSLTALEVRESDRHFCNIHPRPSSSRSHLHCFTTLIL